MRPASPTAIVAALLSVSLCQPGANDPAVCRFEVVGPGEIPENIQTDVPVTYDLTYRYANGVEMNVKNGPNGFCDRDGCSLEFNGSKGWIRRKTWTAAIEARERTPPTSRSRIDHRGHAPSRFPLHAFVYSSGDASLRAVRAPQTFVRRGINDSLLIEVR